MTQRQGLGDDDADIRRLVDEMITNRLGPFLKKLDELSSWRLRIWNDNGGPPGYLQTRRIEDDARHAKLMEETEKQSQVLAKFDSFLSNTAAVQASDDKRRKRQRWILGVAALFAVAFFSWAVPVAWSFTADVVQIVHEWHHIHQSQLKEKSLFEAPHPAPATAAIAPQQDATDDAYRTK